MKTVVQAGQTLLDIAVQEYGVAEAAVLLAQTNDLSLTDSLAAGQVLEVAEQVYDKNMSDYCRNNNVCPATETADPSIRLKIFTEQFTEQFK